MNETPEILFSSKFGVNRHALNAGEKYRHLILGCVEIDDSISTSRMMDDISGDRSSKIAYMRLAGDWVTRAIEVADLVAQTGVDTVGW